MAIGLRPINALVDVTNFFTFDLGRPLHVFDVAKVHGQHADACAWRGAGERLAALNGKTYALTRRTASSPTRPAWKRWAASSAASRPAATKAPPSVFIECALFDPVRIALSGRRHDIRTDARPRFERGVDPALLPDALEPRRA